MTLWEIEPAEAILKLIVVSGFENIFNLKWRQDKCQTLPPCYELFSMWNNCDRSFWYMSPITNYSVARSIHCLISTALFNYCRSPYWPSEHSHPTITLRLLSTLSFPFLLLWFQSCFETIWNPQHHNKRHYWSSLFNPEGVIVLHMTHYIIEYEKWKMKKM